MDLVLEIQERIQYLDDNKKRLVLEIIENFMPELDDDDVLTDEDLHYIALGEQEYANGETVSHNDIKWK